MLIEDNLSRIARSALHYIGVANEAPVAFAVTLHTITGEGLESSVCRRVEPPEAGEWKSLRIGAALSLLDEAPKYPHSVVTAGPNYGGSASFLRGVVQREMSFAVEVPASQGVQVIEGDDASGEAAFRTVSHLAAERTADSDWHRLTVTHPVSAHSVLYAGARVAHVRLRGGIEGWLSVLQTGAILNSPRGAAFVLASKPNLSLEELVRVAGWARWIRPYTRKQLRPDSKGVAENSRQWSLRAISPATERHGTADAFAQVSASRSQPVRVVELFAGAGGMGLGFFMAEHRPAVHLLYSGEVHPVYAETLRINHAVLATRPQNQGMLPKEVKAVDLRREEAQEEAASAVDKANGVDIVIGGPPCQGFSSANRHSWHGGNPHNLLVDTYLRYVMRLQPRIFVMENVQGIISSPKTGQGDASLSVLDYFAQRMTQAGYLVFPKLVDASLYGVPQRRNRCFIVGLHQDLEWDKGDFGSWGPFPRPTHGPDTGTPLVTVEEAIRDLPPIGNGEQRERQIYSEPSAEVLRASPFLQIMRNGEDPGVVTDHVTSRHAEYVIERYRKIPAGGNWQDIRDHLTNYANAERTHSNIYRRLDPKQPSVTIGHYRKSMIVHPSQDRGLSLREATRLQSFPDWFRFAGAVRGEERGNSLGHKQQQLANAVCPLVTKALAEFLFQLLR